MSSSLLRLRRQPPVRGFTLTEVLAVLVVVAALIALSVPALQRARESANASRCMTNLRQLGASVHLRAQDYDGRLPEIVWSEQHRVFELLGPYLGIAHEDPDEGLVIVDDTVLHCPSATAENSGRQWPVYYAQTRNGRQFYTDYKLNDHGVFDDKGNLAGGVKGQPVIGFRDPSWVALAADIDWTPVGRHRGGEHFVFLDGHVAWLTREESAGKDPWGNSPWYAWGM